jgi:hypothetical protein
MMLSPQYNVCSFSTQHRSMSVAAGQSRLGARMMAFLALQQYGRAFHCAASAFAQDAASILEKADTIRFPRESFQVEVSISRPPAAARNTASSASCPKATKTPSSRPSSRHPNAARSC